MAVLNTEGRIREQFQGVDECLWTHFDGPSYNEPIGYLHRACNASAMWKRRKWKGCFHLPRALVTYIRFFSSD